MSGQLTRGLPRQALADIPGVLVVRSPAGLAGRSAVVGRAGVTLKVSAVSTVDESFVPAGDTVEDVGGRTVEPPGSTAPWPVSTGECYRHGPGAYEATLVVEHNGPEGPATVALRIEAT